MFFIMGITDGSAPLEYRGNVNVCGSCGRLGSFEVFMTYMTFTLFFIPIFKWNKKYHVRTSCCGAVYSLSPEKGRMIERHQSVTINPEDLHEESRGALRCSACGTLLERSFEYCPGCGRKL